MSRILLIERRHYEHALLAQALREEGCVVYEVADRHQLTEVVDGLDEAHEPLDLIIADSVGSGGIELELILSAQSLLGQPPLILMTEEVDALLEQEAAALDARFVFRLPCAVGLVKLASQALTHSSSKWSEGPDAVDPEEPSHGSAN